MWSSVSVKMMHALWLCLRWAQLKVYASWDFSACAASAYTRKTFTNLPRTVKQNDLTLWILDLGPFPHSADCETLADQKEYCGKQRSADILETGWKVRPDQGGGRKLAYPSGTVKVAGMLAGREEIGRSVGMCVLEEEIQSSLYMKRECRLRNQFLEHVRLYRNVILAERTRLAASALPYFKWTSHIHIQNILDDARFVGVSHTNTCAPPGPTSSSEHRSPVPNPPNFKTFGVLDRSHSSSSSSSCNPAPNGGREELRFGS